MIAIDRRHRLCHARVSGNAGDGRIGRGLGNGDEEQSQQGDQGDSGDSQANQGDNDQQNQPDEGEQPGDENPQDANAGEQGADEPKDGPAGAQDVEKWASEQAAEQWLRRVPLDPGGLLRRKFLYQYQRAGVDQAGNRVEPPGTEKRPW